MSGAPSAGRARTQSSVLIPRGSISLTLSQPHDPATFYQTRDGLFVYDDYTNRIASKARPVPAGTVYQLAFAELSEEATDKQIERSLPKNYLFDEGAVCAIVAELIGKQQRGELGNLEHTGKANLLYAASCVVVVRWSAGYRGWNVFAWRRGGSRWHAGPRVLSPA
ncbi:MAG: hypothetical protein WB760_08315 [Xanthobacteraceae bacterium]